MRFVRCTRLPHGLVTGCARLRYVAFGYGSPHTPTVTFVYLVGSFGYGYIAVTGCICCGLFNHVYRTFAWLRTLPYICLLRILIYHTLHFTLRCLHTRYARLCSGCRCTYAFWIAVGLPFYAFTFTGYVRVPHAPLLPRYTAVYTATLHPLPGWIDLDASLPTTLVRSVRLCLHVLTFATPPCRTRVYVLRLVATTLRLVYTCIWFTLVCGLHSTFTFGLLCLDLRISGSRTVYRLLYLWTTPRLHAVYVCLHFTGSLHSSPHAFGCLPFAVVYTFWTFGSAWTLPPYTCHATITPVTRIFVRVRQLPLPITPHY